MIYSLLNQIQGKNGSRWAKFIRDTVTDHILNLAIEVARYTHKAIVSTFYGDVLVNPFEFDASLTGFKVIKRKLYQLISNSSSNHEIKEIVVGLETTGHYYEDIVRRCHKERYHVRNINAATTEPYERPFLIGQMVL